MEKGTAPSLFVNDGSFMERFKQLQQEKQEKAVASADAKPSAGSLTLGKPSLLANKRPLETKSSDGKKFNPSACSGKLAFSLKQKSKIAAPAVKLSEDEEEERGELRYGSSEDPVNRQKFGALDVSQPSLQQGDVAPPTPSNSTVRNAADKLASFVAKNGRHFEHVTRQKNPGDTPFKFLFDSSCSDYKYYEYKLLEEENALARTKCSQSTTTIIASSTTSRSLSISRKNPIQQHSNYQTSASALYEFSEDETSSGISVNGDSSGSSPSDPIAMMEYYMKKAAQEERKRPPKQSKDEMPPPASLQGGPEKKGHHMGDYIPPDELQKFLASCNDSAARKAAQEAADRARIQADNIGHKLLSKMGWREGEGLGSSKRGRADPVMAGDVKKDHLGVGAHQPGEVTPDDDIYEQYKKRMMLGYRYRPNPLKNPRKAYY